MMIVDKQCEQAHPDTQVKGDVLQTMTGQSTQSGGADATRLTYQHIEIWQVWKTITAE